MSEDIKKQLFNAIDGSWNNPIKTDRAIELLDSGIDINVVDRDGQTPLMHAVIEINTDIVRHLLEKGANVDIKDGSNETAMDIAGQHPTYDGIVEYGAYKNDFDLANKGVQDIKDMLENAYSLKKRLQHSALIKHGSNEKPNGLTIEESMAHNAMRAPKNLASYIGDFLHEKKPNVLKTPAKGGKRTLKRRKLRNKMSRRKSHRKSHRKSQRKSQRKSHRLSRH